MELIVRNVTEFVGDVELSDDITIVVLRCTRDNGLFLGQLGRK